MLVDIYEFQLDIQLYSEMRHSQRVLVQGQNGSQFTILANPLGLLFRGVLADNSAAMHFADAAVQYAALFRSAIHPPMQLDAVDARRDAPDGANMTITLCDVAAAYAALKLNVCPDFLLPLLTSKGVFDFNMSWPGGLGNQTVEVSRRVRPLCNDVLIK